MMYGSKPVIIASVLCFITDATLPICTVERESLIRAILVIVRLLVYAHLLAEDEAAFTFFAFLFWPAFFIGRKWLEFYRETHPHGESNRAMRIIRSLPPECQDHVLRFLEAERFSSGQVDIDRETERIADILRTIPTEKQEAVLATVARTVEEEPEHDESFYNVGFYS